VHQLRLEGPWGRREHDAFVGKLALAKEAAVPDPGFKRRGDRPLRRAGGGAGGGCGSFSVWTKGAGESLHLVVVGGGVQALEESLREADACLAAAGRRG